MRCRWGSASVIQQENEGLHLGRKLGLIRSERVSVVKGQSVRWRVLYSYVDWNERDARDVRLNYALGAHALNPKLSKFGSPSISR